MSRPWPSGEKIFEPEPEEVVPAAVACNEVVFIGVVASSALIGKITIAVHVDVIVLEVARPGKSHPD